MSMSFSEKLGVMKDVTFVVMGLYKQTVKSNAVLKTLRLNTKKKRYLLKARLEKLGPKVSRGF